MGNNKTVVNGEAIESLQEALLEAKSPEDLDKIADTLVAWEAWEVEVDDIV